MKEIFADFYNRIVEFFSKTEEKDKTKDVARNRLKLVLMQDRTNLNPRLLERLRGEMIDLLSKYVVMDKELLELNFTPEDDQLALMLSIPVIRAKDEEEIEAALKAEDEEKERLAKLAEEAEEDDEEDDDDESDDLEEDIETDNEEDTSEVSDSEEETDETSSEMSENSEIPPPKKKKKKHKKKKYQQSENTDNEEKKENLEEKDNIENKIENTEQTETADKQLTEEIKQEE